jgi:pimeloyl-ACP methyl ester carboxylesterase
MKNFITILITAFLLATVSCQQDDLIAEPEGNDFFLKSYSQVDDYSWKFDIPSIFGVNADGLLALPENWNESPRYLIFYAHGMVDPDEPIALPNDVIDGKSIEQIVLEMGMGYATTSYGANGLVADKAVEDIRMLVEEVNTFFEENVEYLPPKFMFLGGPSEGGLVTILTIERYPDLVHGALSICGPIGNFYQQLQYNGNFHVLFNYFFEEELQGTYDKYVGNPEDGVGGQDSTMGDWNDGYIPLSLQWSIDQLMQQNPSKVKQLLNCAKVKSDMTDQEAMRTVVFECLRFNVKLTNDVISRLTGTPFNNSRKWYWGSKNDWRLNRSIQRICPDNHDIIKEKVNDYETTGETKIPIVSVHTTGDHITPYWHQTAYRLKIWKNGNGKLYTGIPVANYGHCTIEESHLVAALAILITKATLIDLFAINNSVFSSDDSAERFKQIMNENSIEFEIVN